MHAAGSEHELLLRHFSTWAEQKRRHADLDLLEELLTLRSTYDDLEPTYWPSDSVEHLILERWPSKGGVETPDPEVLSETLDAYFRFLRNTGRMSGRSADPKALTKEARRAARRLPDVAGDPSNWSPGKVLMDFGRQIGVDLQDAEDEETVRARLAAIQEAWNALPMAERQRRMPGPGQTMSEDEDRSGRERAMDAYGIDDEIVALLMTFADSLPTGELPPEDVVAPLVRRAPFTKRVLELAAWVGDGREVTATRVLRPALAREVHDILELGDWTRAQMERRYPDERLPGVAAVGRDAWIEREVDRPWRSAADCDALHRLWLGVAACGLIEISGRKAYAVAEPDRDDEGWVSTGVRAAVGAMNQLMERPYHAVPLIYGLMASYVRGRALVPMDELVEFQQSWVWTPREQAEYGASPWFGALDRVNVSVALGAMADTGLYVETQDGIALTEFGDVFVAAWLEYMEG